MKNITVSIPDELYLEARVMAARRGTSVSALVKIFIESIIEDQYSDRDNFESEGYPHPPYFPCNCETVKELHCYSCN